MSPSYRIICLLSGLLILALGGWVLLTHLSAGRTNVVVAIAGTMIILGGLALVRTALLANRFRSGLDYSSKKKA